MLDYIKRTLYYIVSSKIDPSLTKYYRYLGANIGENCIIAAGSIVTKDVESNTIVAGVPAEKIGNVDDNEQRHLDELMCIADFSFKKKKEILTKKFSNNP